MTDANTAPSDLRRKAKRKRLVIVSVAVLVIVDLLVLTVAPLSWQSWLYLVFPVDVSILFLVWIALERRWDKQAREEIDWVLK